MKPYKAVSWWHRDRDKRVLEMVKNGIKVSQIASELQYTNGTITKILKHYGLKYVNATWKMKEEIAQEIANKKA